MTDNNLSQRVYKLLMDNMETGGGKGKPNFHFTRPSPARYPYQFFWDTCFHVFIWCSLNEPDMAQKHLRSLFAFQEKDGFVGHMIYWNRLTPGRITDFFQSAPRFRNLFRSHMSAIIQPPMAAQALERVYNISEDDEFLKEMFPKLKAQYAWLAKNRDFDGDGLLSIISPFESGMDWKPTFDIPLGFRPKKANKKLFWKVVGVDLKNYIRDYDLEKIRKKGYFLVKEVGLNTIYAQNLRVMANLADLMDDPEAGNYDKLAEKVEKSILRLMYDEEDAAFYDCFGKDDTPIKILTPTIFYPVILESTSSEIGEKVMEKHFFKGEEFQTDYPIPSLATNEAAFDPNSSIYIWRGPTWIVNNWFLHKYLVRKKYTEEAERLIDSIMSLIEKSGFREYYNPFTGEGHGAENFTWCGLVLDMINSVKEANED